MNISTRLATEPIRSIANAAIPAGSFAAIGGANAAITHEARMIVIANLTNADLYISDETAPVYPAHIKYVLAARQTMILDCTSNRTDTGGSFCYAKDTRFSVAQLTAPTTGSVYLSVIYAEV